MRRTEHRRAGLHRRLLAGVAVAVVAAIAGAAPAPAQTRSRVRPAPKVATRREPAKVTCPATLGKGVTTGRVFCDVLTGRDPSDGILIEIPPHRGRVTLTFDLHARHTFSAETVKAGRAFASYMATVGILTMNNDLVQRAVVQAEFRTLHDAFDRIGGGAGPNGLKAVLPVSVEPIRMSLAPELETVSLLGEKVHTVRLDGDSTTAMPGRAVAIVSNIEVEYQPAPAKAPPRRKRHSP